jgi:hypothetical protein
MIYLITLLKISSAVVDIYAPPPKKKKKKKKKEEILQLNMHVLLFKPCLYIVLCFMRPTSVSGVLVSLCLLMWIFFFCSNWWRVRVLRYNNRFLCRVIILLRLISYRSSFKKAQIEYLGLGLRIVRNNF